MTLSYFVSLHNSCLRLAPISYSLADPAIKSFVHIHPQAMHWSMQFNTIHHMMNHVHAYVLKCTNRPTK